MCLLLALSMSGAAVAKQDVTVELFYSSAWHDVTSRVLTGESIVINHGAGDEQDGVIPSDASLTFLNSDGEMNPENRKSSLFGLIGHNTGIRITVGSDIRFTGQVASWKPRRALGEVSESRGKAWVDIQAQGTIRRLGQGEPPTESALYQTITRAIGVNPIEYWPLEAGRLTFASTVSGGVASSFFDPEILAQQPTFTGIPGSQPSIALPAIDSATIVAFPVATYTDTGFWAAQAAWDYTSAMLPDGLATLDVVLSNGRTVHLFLDGDSAEPLEFSAAVTDDVTLYYSDAVDLDGASVLDTPLSPMLSLTSAAGGTLTARLLDGTGAIRAELTTTGVGYGTVARIELSNVPGLSLPAGSLGVAHLVLYADTSFDIDIDTVTIAWATSGFTGETAGDRFERICGIENISATIVGTAAETQTMGPQRPGTVLDWFGKIARTDAGIIYDTRDELGLTFRTGRSLYNQ